MENNYSSLKYYNSLFLVDEIIFKINIFLNKQTFQIYIIIIKIKIIKKLISLSQFTKKKYIFLRKYNYMSKIFLEINLKFYSNITTHNQINL